MGSYLFCLLFRIFIYLQFSSSFINFFEIFILFLLSFSNRPDAHQKHLSRLEREFYKSYDSHEGFITAIVLGGFFAFVCLLVMYKTKCKPMWKNRRKRLTTTPATASVAELDDNVVGNGSLIPPAVVHQQFDSDNCQFDEEDDEFGFGKLRFFHFTSFFS